MKIIVRGTNWIGDAAMSVPALRNLRSVFPDAHIVLHTRAWAEGVFQDADFVDEILTIDESVSRLRSVIAQATILRRVGFDIAVIFPNSFETALIPRLAGINKIFGYAADRRRFLLSHAVAVPEWKASRHEVFYYTNLIDAVAREAGRTSHAHSEPDASLPVSDARRRSALEFLKAHGVDVAKPIIALAPGSKNSRAKRWIPENYASLGNRYVGELNANVILVGAADETDISQMVTKLTPENLIDLTGKTSLADAAAILSVCDLLVANDMGLAHLAPAGGTPTIVIFGPTDPRTTRPFGEHAVVVRVDVECSPCMLRDCPIDHRCMTRITPDAVFQTSLRLLNSLQGT